MRLKLASPRLRLVVDYTIDDRRHYSIGIPITEKPDVALSEMEIGLHELGGV